MAVERRWVDPGSEIRSGISWAGKGRSGGLKVRDPGSEVRGATSRRASTLRGPRSEVRRASCARERVTLWVRGPPSEFPCKRGQAAAIQFPPALHPQEGGREGPSSAVRSPAVDWEGKGEGPRPVCPRSYLHYDNERIRGPGARDPVGPRDHPSLVGHPCAENGACRASIDPPWMYYSPYDGEGCFWC